MSDGHNASDQPSGGTDASASRPRHFRRGILLTTTSTGVAVVSLFAETIIAARVLSTSDYGVYVLVMAVVGFFVTAVDFGFKAAITQMIAGGSPEEQEVLANMAILSRVVVVLVAALALWLVRGVLTLFDPSEGLMGLAFYLPLLLAVVSFDELLLSILQGFRAYSRLAIAQIARTMVRLTLSAVFLLVFKLGLLGLIYSWIISYFLGVLYELIAVPVRKRLVFSGPLFRDLVRFGMPLQGNRFLWYLSERVDVLLLGTLAGPGAVAFFSVANKVPDALQRLAESFIAVYYPTVSSLIATKRMKQAHWYLNHSLRLVSFITALGTLVAVAFGKQIMHLVFSDKYLVSATAFGVLMLSFHILLSVNLLGYTLTAARNAGKSLAANVFLTVSQAAADWVLIPILNFLGPAVASNISASLNLPANILLLRRVGIRVDVAPLAKQTLLLLACAGFFWWFQPEGVAIKLAAITAYVIICALLGLVSAEDLSLVVPERILRRRIVLPNEAVADGAVAEAVAEGGLSS